ncbi:hypothetical protein GTO87_02920 [Ligilactobacillus saerimneri]|uniref:Uncharacterized protein n=1 Tax=Ligilactobacillus saerimneri TaxID=228229 RepID=A0A7H9EIV4_9LACO|nr:hypothetical protein [Ligilactobacillus saerimneri]QLL77643.1 hypothetical protein GTO87_02920 [Ligilactobacillus saerimneri]
MEYKQQLADFYKALYCLMEHNQFHTLIRCFYEFESESDWEGLKELYALTSRLGAEYLEDESSAVNYVKNRIEQLEE